MKLAVPALLMLAIASAAAANDAAVEAFVDGLATAQLESSGVPGVVVSVVRNGETLLLKGYGWADVERQRAVDPHTLFRIGSITKLFTYTALMQLVEQGRIDLNQDINTYLGDARIAAAFGAPITPNHLLAHRGGFESGDLGYDFFGDAGKVPTLRQFVIDHQLQRVRPPGQATAYSNFGATVLGLAVETTSGEPYGDYVERHILTPLQMTQSSLREPAQKGRGTRTDLMPDTLAAQAAIGYVRSAGLDHPLPYEYIAPAAAPAGSMFSTGADMARFMNAWLAGGPPLVSSDTLRMMWKREYPERAGTTDFAHGFSNGRIAGHETFGHTGSMLGFKSSLQLVPELGLGVFVAVNSEQGWTVATTLPQQILRHLANAAAEADPAYVERDLARYAGRYLTARRSYTKLEKILKLQTGMASVVPTTDGRLVIARAGDVRTWLPIAPMIFRDVAGTERVRFETTPGGEVIRFYGSMGHEPFERIGWLQSPSALYSAIALACALALTTLLTARRAGQNPLGRNLSLLRVIVAALTLVFAVALYLGFSAIRAQGWMIEFNWPPSALVRAVWTGYLLVLAALAMMPGVWLAWRRSGWPLLRKLHYCAFTAALVAMLLGLWQWNFFASPYN